MRIVIRVELALMGKLVNKKCPAESVVVDRMFAKIFAAAILTPVAPTAVWSFDCPSEGARGANMFALPTSV